MKTLSALGVCAPTLLLFVTLTNLAAQTTIHVPADQPDIQAAIDVAVDGDTVLVAPDTYFGITLDFGGKAITVRSAMGSSMTTLLGTSRDRIIEFTNGEGPNSVLEGFTLTGGIPPSGSDGHGGGIYIVGASPIICNCFISGNEATSSVVGPGGHGGGIYVRDGSPRFENCDVMSNHAGDGTPGGNGGGYYLEGNGSVVVVGGTIVDNFAGNGIPSGSGGAGGGVFAAPGMQVEISGVLVESNAAGSGSVQGGHGGGIAGATHIERCLIRDNVAGNATPPAATPATLGLSLGGSGGGISTSALVVGCVIAENRAGGGTVAGLGGGAFLMPGARVLACTVVENTVEGGGQGGGLFATAADVENCIVWENSLPSLALSGGSVSFSCVEGGAPGLGNIDVAPRLVAPDFGIYRLAVASPCVDAGFSGFADLPATDREGLPRFAGVNIDIGAHELDVFSNDFLPGSAEDFELLTLVNGTGNPDDGHKAVVTGDQILVTALSPLATFDGVPAALAAQVFMTGGARPTAFYPFGELQLNPNRTLVIAFAAALPAVGLQRVAVAFPWLAGLTVRLQAIAATPAARNGFLAFSDAHDLEFQ